MALISVYNDLTGLRWLRKYFKGRERHAYLGLESWAEPGIAVYFMPPPATGAVERIAALYAIEKEIRGRLPTSDAAFATPARGPLLDAMHAWQETSLSKLSRNSDTSAAIHYALARWDAFARYCDDGLTSPSPKAGLCGAGAAGLCVSPDGTIRPCMGLNLPLGRWPTDSLSDIWHNSKFFSAFGSIRLRDIPQCRECSDFAYCSRCPGAWHAENGDFCKPTTYACTLAHTWAETQRGLRASRKGDEYDEANRQN